MSYNDITLDNPPYFYEDDDWNEEIEEEIYEHESSVSCPKLKPIIQICNTNFNIKAYGE